MQRKVVSLAAPILIGIMAQALGWFAHAAVPLSAQGIVVDRRASLSDPAGPAAPGFCPAATLLTYQGRLTDAAGAAIISTVSVVFKLYDSTPALLWTSATRSITPTNGLFTVYLGDSVDPCLDTVTLSEAASIGVTVGGDAEMTPRQAINTVVGHGYFVGVVGNSTSGTGVLGRSTSSTGVFGFSHSGQGAAFGSDLSDGVAGTSVSGYGVVGQTSVNTAAGVEAITQFPAGIALEIGRGGIKATGAGGNTNTFAFIHISSGTDITGTLIDNALTNGDQTAMLFVTHVSNPPGVGENDFNRAFGVKYDAGASKWRIHAEDGAAIPVGVTFNVMVIKR